VSQGFLSFDDLSVIEPDELAEMGSLTAEQCDEIVAYAERESERLEGEQRQRRAMEREQAALAAQQAEPAGDVATLTETTAPAPAEPTPEAN
jgi:N utilization substance protein A